MSFEHIRGQERAIAQVQAWLKTRRLPHAILICGPAGTGKRRLAIELAKAINCREGFGEACDRCVSCHKIETLIHPDVLALLPHPPRRVTRGESRLPEGLRKALLEYVGEGGSLPRVSANIPRDHIRILQREMSYSPLEAARKTGLIFEAECMSSAGANSLLKILEEPPGNAIFILVSPAPHRLLPTIRSRCQLLPLGRLSQEEVINTLQSKGLEPHRAELAARIGAGSLQRSAQVISEDFDQTRDQVEAFLWDGLNRKDESYWTVLDRLGTRENRERIESFLEICGLYLRDLFLLAHGREKEIVHFDRLDFLLKLQSIFDLHRIEAAAMEIDRSLESLARNVNSSLVLVDLWRQLRNRSSTEI